MTVVSDTSVLIHLARIDRFQLLRQLYSNIVVPHAVWRETVDEGEERPGAPEARTAREASWLAVTPV